uniref:NADH-ubiquinone oxidoreductase chain 3 n=1 Tax=Streptocephalus sirindhornae TaxID=91588 RepID=A0A0U1Z6F9_9CRUS|nr:NADH dehydrogenase subunit 3 [Streptocephalus sirindhornae]AJP09640.1 NADH dehydrogenase subunit 3 [Streptocephalus sirindhornae]
MILILVLWSIIFILVSVMLTLSIIINKKMMIDREKSSPFECGFDPQNSSRMPFSMRFFIITLIFLIFDVEIALLLPMNILSINFTVGVSIILFVIILLVGVLYEWKEGALSWIK